MLLQNTENVKIGVKFIIFMNYALQFVRLVLECEVDMC